MHFTFQQSQSAIELKRNMMQFMLFCYTLFLLKGQDRIKQVFVPQSLMDYIMSTFTTLSPPKKKRDAVENYEENAILLIS